MKGAHNVVDGQCLDCGLKESDTHDSFPIETYCCIPNDWRALPDVPSNVRLYLAAPTTMPALRLRISLSVRLRFPLRRRI